MTSVGQAARTGRGKILGVFRTLPAPAREVVEERLAILKGVGIGGVYTLGHTSESLYQIPVAMNRIGMVQLGGLNPVAAAVESGIEIENIAESGLIDFNELKDFSELS
jgi:repressor of nif and glnA expression